MDKRECFEQQLKIESVMEKNDNSKHKHFQRVSESISCHIALYVPVQPMLRGLQTWLSPSTTTSPSPLKYIQVIFFSLVLKIERISNSWVIHYSAATCLLSLLTLVIFKLKGIGLKRRGMGFWNVSHENSQVALRSPGKERDEKSTSETDQRTDRRTDCEDD